MDFGAVLHIAQQKTQTNKNEGRYYKTKFEAPKKEERKNTQLSENIQKFLARQAAEEKKKAEEARIKKQQLLALRAQDSKAKKRVQFMLNRTKSANRSVIEDAVDNQNTSLTLAGGSQPDEDDYGYESQESALIYAKMLERYNAMPEEEKFPGSKKKSVSTNLQSTKERVKAALLKEEEEANAPHKRKRKSKPSEDDKEDKPKEGKYDKYEEKEKEKEKPPKPKRPPPPPAMNFAELLKIAEKKQYEPIIIEPKKVEEETLMTKKQRREAEKERAYREAKEQRAQAKLREALTAPLKSKEATLNKIPKLSDSKKMPPPNRIPKVGAPKPDLKKPSVPPKKPEPPQKSQKVESSKKPEPEKKYLPGDTRYKPPPAESKPERKYLPGDIRYKPPTAEELKKAKLEKSMEAKPKQFPPADVRRKVPENGKRLEGKPKQFPPGDVRPKQFPPADVRPKQFPPPDVRSKQFPPPDVRRKGPPPPSKNKPRRPIIEDDDSEYDSELDDFIDDGPIPGEEDYSKHIREIFGYDKSRYRDVDDEDDAAMESKFCTIMKEEQISAKIGLMEDLEDMRREEEHIRRKALMKKKMKR